MNIKITFDPDGAYGYPKGEIIDGQQLVNDYIETLNEVEDADTISFLKRIEIEKAVDFVAEMWDLSYDIIPDDKVIRKCTVCGKQITEGYVFDGTDCFCSKECATSFFDNDEGCVDILIDDGERRRCDWFADAQCLTEGTNKGGLASAHATIESDDFCLADS